jgi:hypothetical protein
MIELKIFYFTSIIIFGLFYLFSDELARYAKVAFRHSYSSVKSYIVSYIVRCEKFIDKWMVCIIDMYILKPEDPIHVRVYNYICTVLRESRPYQWILRFLFSTNHKDIGTLYILWAVFASLVGSMLSLIIRTQLAVPGNTIVEDS